MPCNVVINHYPVQTIIKIVDRMPMYWHSFSLATKAVIRITLITLSPTTMTEHISEAVNTFQMS